jgi:hypothetical protein
MDDKIDQCLEFCADTFMLCELFTVVECNGVASILEGGQQACCPSRYAVGMLTTNNRGLSTEFLPCYLESSGEGTPLLGIPSELKDGIFSSNVRCSADRTGSGFPFLIQPF